MDPKPSFNIDNAALRKLEQEAKKKLQPRLDKAVQDVVRGVNADMARQPAAKVLAELVERLEKLGVAPNRSNLTKVASEIEKGTLKI